MEKFIKVIAIPLIIAFLASPSIAAEIREKSTTGGFKAGLTSPGTFWVGESDFDTDMSYNFGGFIDYKLGPKISGGLLVNAINFVYRDESSMMMELGFTIKAWLFSENSNLTFTPGFGISYGRLGSSDYVDESDYLIINGMVDMIIGMENYNLLVEVGITGSPTGGNDDWEMTYGPGFTIRGGILF